jgi:hypothetical protein
MNQGECVNASIHARHKGEFQRSGMLKWYDPEPYLSDEVARQTPGK